MSEIVATCQLLLNPNIQLCDQTSTSILTIILGSLSYLLHYDFTNINKDDLFVHVAVIVNVESINSNKISTKQHKCGKEIMGKSYRIVWYKNDFQ